jgi:hypothetical protein
MHDRSFQIPASSTTLRRESFYPRTIREWNSLPANVATAGSLETCYTIFTGASKNRLYHLFQLADEDLEGFKASCSGNIGWQ